MKLFDIEGIKNKLKVFKKRSDDIYCASCGVRTGIFTRESLLAGKCLCAVCQNRIPMLYRKKLNCYTIEEYTELVKYLKEESKPLESVFVKSHRFSDLMLDVDHGILCYKHKNTPTIYFKLENVVTFDLRFYGNPEETGIAELSLICSHPNIDAADTIDECCTLDEMDDFLMNCRYAINKARARA